MTIRGSILPTGLRMKKRDLIRHLPGFSRLVKALDDLEPRNRQLMDQNRQLAEENRQLAVNVQYMKNLICKVIFKSETALLEDEIPTSSKGANGLPVPAGFLRYLVTGVEDLNWFLHTGQLGVQGLVDVLARQGRTLNQFKKILDFGCGCGRVIRHLKGMTGAEIHGSDSNRRAIEWCERYLSFARFTVNSLEPPLAYPDQTFDLIYAFSVFTHLTEPLQARWMDELRRVLVPGGLLIFSVHGDKFAETLPPAERLEYRKGKMVVCGAETVGTNYCGAYHPASYVRDVMARGFEVVDFIPEGNKGNPGQDAHVMRSPLN